MGRNFVGSWSEDFVVVVQPQLMDCNKLRSKWGKGVSVEELSLYLMFKSPVWEK